LKKLLSLNGIILLVMILVSVIISLVSDIKLTDCLFIGAMVTLAGAAAYLVLARREMRKSVKNKSKDEKKKYRQSFRETEAQAFILAVVSIILFIGSFISVKP